MTKFTSNHTNKDSCAVMKNLAQYELPKNCAIGQKKTGEKYWLLYIFIEVLCWDLTA
jgi:hypothetical protein